MSRIVSEKAKIIKLKQLCHAKILLWITVTYVVKPEPMPDVHDAEMELFCP